MQKITCTICQTTNILPIAETLLVATFPNMLSAKEAVYALQKAHITLSGYEYLSREEITKKYSSMFIDADTLLIQLHGIKDIVNLQTLYIESICQEKGSLTFDSFAKKSRENLLRKLG